MHKGPIQVPGKDRFLRQRCSAQFVSVRATRFLAAKAVTGLEPGEATYLPGSFNLQPKTTMYKNIIKLATIAAKDTPAVIMKKIRKHDPRFAQERDLEIESYLSRKTSLNFPDFAVLLEDCYARYAIEEEFINRFTDDVDQRHVMYEEVKLSVPELRCHGWRPYEVIWEQVGEKICYSH